MRVSGSWGSLFIVPGGEGLGNGGNEPIVRAHEPLNPMVEPTVNWRGDLRQYYNFFRPKTPPAAGEGSFGAEKVVEGLSLEMAVGGRSLTRYITRCRIV